MIEPICHLRSRSPQPRQCAAFASEYFFLTTQNTTAHINSLTFSLVSPLRASLYFITGSCWRLRKILSMGQLKKKSLKSHHSRHQWITSKKGMHCTAISVTISQPEEQSSLRTTESLNCYSSLTHLVRTVSGDTSKIVSAQLGWGGSFKITYMSRSWWKRQARE